MRAVAVFPEKRRVGLVNHPEPRIASPTQVKVRMLEVGVCGTDKSLCAFEFGDAPQGSDYFVLGHESLGEVVETGPGVRGLAPGDLVVGTVRLPCRHSGCVPCGAGRQDFCATGAYFEHGIKALHGFMAEYVVEEERYLNLLPPALRGVGVLVEPLTIAEKALEQMDAIGRRLPWKRERRRAVVVGSGAVGLLGAMLLIERGYQTWVYSRSRAPNPKAAIAEAIGAEYISSLDEPAERLAARIDGIDVVYEAAGAPQASWDVLRHIGPNSVFVLTSVPHAGERIALDLRELSLDLVLRNQVLAGTVNAAPADFAAAIRDLGTFMGRWPKAVGALITGRYPMERFMEPVTGAAGGIKSVIEIRTQ